MEIIKEGTIPSERTWRGTCHNCRTVAKAKQSELDVRSDQRNGEWAETKCPVCNERMLFHPIRTRSTK